VPLHEVKSLPGYPLHEVDYVSGTVFLARAGALQEIGLLDEDYFFSGEIADFCKRARDRGHKICVDLEVEARHDTGQTPKEIRDTLHAYYSLRNRFLYVSKQHAPERTKYFAQWTLAGALALARAVGHGRLARARAIVLALTDACCGRYGNRNARFL
jgi:GT2 family glycosyltransferase